jgi:integrase
MPLKLVKRHNSDFWYIRGTVRGVTVDESTRLTRKEDADALRARREWELTQGAVFGRRATATFLQAAVSYMDAGGEKRFMRPVIEKLGRVQLSKIDQDMIDIVAREVYPEASNSTLNRQFYTPVSAVLKHAHDRKLCDHLVIKRPSQPPGRVRWISSDEAERLIDACAKHLRPLVIFLLYTGARLSEALYLEWSQVDLNRAHVSFLETKNGEPRGVPLHPRVVAELANLEKRNSSAVFRRPDGMPYEPKEGGGGQIKTAFGGACKRAGIVDFSPHDCRHTFATWYYAKHRDLVGLKRLGGWKTDAMVLRYTHINTDDLAASINALPWGNSGDSEKPYQFKPTKTGA